MRAACSPLHDTTAWPTKVCPLASRGDDCSHAISRLSLRRALGRSMWKPASLSQAPDPSVGTRVMT